MGIFSGNPQNEPMHYGEVFTTWSYLLASKGMLDMYQAFYNHAGDEDLRRLLKEAIQNIKSENEQIEELLKLHGIGLPPTPAERPDVQIENIPVGARIMDMEIGAILAADVSKGLVTCSTIMGQSLREDIGMMFGQFHMKKAQFGVKVLRLNKEKGWVIPPPLHLENK